MSRGPYPLLLTLAISMPGVVGAVGLGDIRVDSALNEPLSAQIEIVGATADDLVELTATVASRETFQRYGADRPAFLSSAIFKVAQDSQGRPILAVHSGQAFTDPLVSLLVDLRWSHGELIREYSLLLDPPELADTHRASQMAAVDASAVPEPEAVEPAEAKIATVTQRVESEPARAVTAAPAVPAAPAVAAMPAARPVIRALQATAPAHGSIAHHRISARDTLRGIVRHAGARSESSVQRMMIAIFRANPGAFEGNINRLRKGATLNLPTAAEWSAISSADARREVQTQMLAWHNSASSGGRRRSSAAVQVAGAVPTPATARESPASVPARETTLMLDQRVQSLEQSLDDLKSRLAAEHAKLAGIQQQVAGAATAPQQVAAAPPAHTATAVAHTATAALPAVAPAGAKMGQSRLVPIAAGLGILTAGLVVMRLRRDRNLVHTSDARPLEASHAEDSPLVDTQTAAGKVESPAKAMSDATPVEAPASEAPKLDPAIETTLKLPLVALANQPIEPSSSTTARMASGDTTVNLAMDTAVLDGGPVEFDTTAQHVQMPSVMNEHVVVAERRTNIVHVLRMAIEREPHRRDLHLKLLEVYYSAASNNRQAFLEIAKMLAREREHLTADEWEKILKMGRAIAADDALFADPAKADDTLAHCA
jgi:pilus assembly protein FimV